MQLWSEDVYSILKVSQAPLFRISVLGVSILVTISLEVNVSVLVSVFTFFELR